MSVLTPLVSFGIRAAFDIDGDDAAHVIENVFGGGKRALPEALARANDRAWQAVGLALAGDGFLDRIKGLWAGSDVRAVRDQLRQFVEQAPGGFQGSSAELRACSLDEFLKLRKNGRISFRDVSAELAQGAARLPRLGNAAELRTGAERAVAGVADGLASEAPHLSQLLRQTIPDGSPILAAAFAYFFRRELEQNAELARGMTLDSLRLLSASQERGFAQLEQDLGSRIDTVFNAMNEWFAHVSSELAAVRADLKELLERNHVVTAAGSGSPTVSVTDRREQETLRQIRDRLRQLPPGMTPADVLLRMGDGLAAAGQFEQA